MKSLLTAVHLMICHDCDTMKDIQTTRTRKKIPCHGNTCTKPSCVVWGNVDAFYTCDCIAGLYVCCNGGTCSGYILYCCFQLSAMSTLEISEKSDVYSKETYQKHPHGENMMEFSYCKILDIVYFFSNSC